MRCNSTKKQLSAFIDEMLEPVEKRNVQEHLDRCKECSYELTDLKNTIAILGTMEEISLPSNFHHNVLAAWSTEIKNSNKYANIKMGVQRRKNWLNVGIGIAAVAATIFVGNNMLGGNLAVPRQKPSTMLSSSESASFGASPSIDEGLSVPAQIAEDKPESAKVSEKASGKMAELDSPQQPAKLEQYASDQIAISSALPEKATVRIENTARSIMEKFSLQAKDGTTNISNVEVILENDTVNSNKMEEISLQYKASIIDELEQEIIIKLNQNDAAQLVDTLLTDGNNIRSFSYVINDPVANTTRSADEKENSETAINSIILLRFILKS